MAAIVKEWLPGERSEFFSKLPPATKQGMWAKEQGLPFEYNPYKDKKGEEEDSEDWDLGWCSIVSPNIYKRGKLTFD